LAIADAQSQLTAKLDRFVLAKVKSGRYENASEVIRAALRTLERDEEQYQAKLSALRTTIDEGDAGESPGRMFSRAFERL
jgi:antitoxin ParD1/3/4